jgi:hypothetical protein
MRHKATTVESRAPIGDTSAMERNHMIKYLLAVVLTGALVATTLIHVASAAGGKGATPAVPATPATPAVPGGKGVPATPAKPATPATPAVPK